MVAGYVGGVQLAEGQGVGGGGGHGGGAGVVLAEVVERSLFLFAGGVEGNELRAGSWRRELGRGVGGRCRRLAGSCSGGFRGEL